MSASMIVYMGVANTRCVLAEACDGPDTYAAMVRRVLPSVADVTSRTSASAGQSSPYVLHILPEADTAAGRARSGAGRIGGASMPAISGTRESSAQAVRYLCLAHKDYGQVLPMQALERLATLFRERFDLPKAGSAAEVQAAATYGPGFEPSLRTTILQFTDPTRDKMEKLKGHLGKAKGNLADSIEAALERGTALEDLEEDSAALRRQTASFAASSGRIARDAAWRRWRGRAMAAGAGLIGIIVVSMLACGPGLCLWGGSTA